MRPAQEAASGLRPWNIAEVEHHLDVIDAHVAERALEQARRPDRRHQRRVAAEAATVDADAILVRVALFDRPFRGVDDVVLDAFGPLLVAGIPEGLAVAARAAVIHLEHAIAAPVKDLRFAVDTPAVARSDRAAARLVAPRQVAATRA